MLNAYTLNIFFLTTITISTDINSIAALYTAEYALNMMDKLPPKNMAQ